MPEVKDNEDDFESLKPSTGEATPFLKYSEQDRAFMIAKGATNSTDAGVYNISIRLQDALLNVNSYNFVINVTCKVQEVEEKYAFPGVLLVPKYQLGQNRTSLVGKIRRITS